MAADLTRGERLQIMLTEEELKALDDWRFARRMPSRAAAVRELLKRGLAAEGIVLDGRADQIRGFRRHRRQRVVQARRRRKILRRARLNPSPRSSPLSTIFMIV